MRVLVFYPGDSCDSNDSWIAEFSAMLTVLDIDVTVSTELPNHGKAGSEFLPDLVFLPLTKLNEIESWRESIRVSNASSVNSVREPDVVIWVDTEKPAAALSVSDILDVICVPCSSVELEVRIRNYRSLREMRATSADQERRLTWHRERMIQEHNIVQNMFANAFSRHLSDDDHVETFLRPLSNFNGDLFLLARGGTGSLYFLLGDFTGHGLAAAIGTIPASQTFFAMAKRSAPVSQMAQEINRQLHQLLPSDMFCCALIVEMSATGDRINWWSGGIPPALMIAPGSHEISYLEPQHVPLGVLSPVEFDSGIISMRIPHGTRILAYTDGLIELGTHEGAPLRTEQLVSAGQANDWDMAKLTHWIEGKVEETAPHDDLSVVMLTCSPTGFYEEKSKDRLSQLPFSLNVTVGPNEARTLDPIAAILRGLSQFDGMERFRPRLYTVLSEAYNNALEHGVLRMPSKSKAEENGFENYYLERGKRLSRLQRGQIDIELSYQPNLQAIQVKVRDSGTGFRYDEADCDASNQHRGEAMFGRGLHLIRELTRDLRWTEDGRCIEFSVPLEDI